MRTINMPVVGEDNEIVWLVRITDGTNTYRLATEAITLSTNAYDGDALSINSSRFSFNEFGKRINIVEGGTVGEISSVTFSFKRNASNSLLADFFNEFYPATSGKNLIAQKVEVGIIWRGSTDEDEVTWLYAYGVNNYSYDQSNINLTCSEFAEFENIMLPFYEVQKDYDNGISYTKAVEDDAYGQPIPIVYGSLATTTFGEGSAILAPTVLFDKTKATVKIASHECKETVKGNYTAPGNYYIIFKSIGEGSAYLQIYTTDGSEVNDFSGCSTTLQNTAQIILGYARIPFTGLGGLSDVDDVIDATDGDNATYTDLDCDGTGDFRMSLKINGNISSSDVGVLSRANDNDINAIWLLSTAGGATRNIRMYFYNSDNSPDNIGMQSATTIASATAIEKSGSGFARTEIGKTGYPVPVGAGIILPYTIEELVNYEYVLENENTTPGEKVRVHGGYLLLQNILVSGSITTTWKFRRG